MDTSTCGNSQADEEAKKFRINENIIHVALNKEIMKLITQERNNNLRIDI